MLGQVLEQYRMFFRLPDSKSIALATFVSRMPYGMLAFALLMFLRDATHSFALAGAAVGIYFVAMAITSPVMGRVIDRTGPIWPLRITGVMQPLSLLAIYIVASYGGSLALIFATAALAGGFAVPIAVLTRTLSRHRFDDEHMRRVAFAVDSILIELNYTMGPAVAAAILATYNAGVAYLTSIGVLVVGVLAFMRSPSLKYWKQQPHAERHLLGPLTEPRLLILLTATFGLSFGFGVLEVAYPAYATALNATVLSGMLLGLCSAGSAMGGVAYGGLQFPWRMERQFSTVLAIIALMLLAHTASDARSFFLVIAFAAGCAIAPAITMQSLLVSRYAPPKYATEAFTWSSTFIVVGIGFGTASTGWIVEHWSLNHAFYIGASAVGVAALLALGLPAWHQDAAAPGINARQIPSPRGSESAG
jgi:MFS family permease